MLKQDFDFIGSANPELVARLMYSIITGLQDYSRDTQLLAISSLLILASEYYEADVSEVLQTAENIMRKNSDLEQFKAAKDYLRNELKR